ncbi:unnamed protein product [Acanthoscelides obtectus]|uniref:Carboxylesterase type B domain-containing protein n=1 Tax=Acanthoscelides obtectus TaxID=200917 RepID=A0A9P0K8F4_ACAOB|nr:unnamed protein product [Acanthoscelides obtectus]CAK1665903.1 Neuroligin-4, X-linked [Acanthoscelides obtectus]
MPFRQAEHCVAVCEFLPLPCFSFRFSCFFLFLLSFSSSCCFYNSSVFLNISGYRSDVIAKGNLSMFRLPFLAGAEGFLRTRPGSAMSSASTSSASSSETKEEPSGGNLAIKDVVAALKWVKTNIGAFGGDPKRVTLVGHDTGAAIANLLFVMPSSKGLFHRVILLSGTALSSWATIHDADSIRLSVGKQTGCLATDATGDEDIDIASCLRSRNGNIATTLELLLFKDKSYEQ